MVKSSSTVPYCFVSGQTDKSKVSTASKYVLSIRQQPVRAKVCGAKERDRRPIDPPPIVQIKLADPSSDKNKDYLQSPYLFMCCNLVHDNDPSGEIVAPAHRALAGTVVSSLNRLKDVDNSDGGFFVFGDMSARIEGRFRLRFTLLELIEGEVVHVMTTLSNPMTVYSSKTFPGMSESTFLSRSFSDQGVRIRIRKDHHVKPKRPVSVDIDDNNMHSPPSSCHELSDGESSQHVKRPKSSSTGDSSRRYSMGSRPKHSESRHSSPEPLDRTPPSSPGSYIGQDSAPSRPRHNPYMWDDIPRHSDGRPHHRSSSSSRYSDPRYSVVRSSSSSEHHPESRRHRHDHPAYQRPSHDSQSSQPRENPRRSYSTSHPRHKERTHSRDRAARYSSSYHHHHYHAHERGYPYPERYPSSYHDLSPPHPMSAAHSFPSPVHSSLHHYPHSSSRAHPAPVPYMIESHKVREPVSHHGFPEAMINEQDMEYTPEPYHSRTPSMSSQHSEGNFSPPHPFSPPESHAPKHAASSRDTPPIGHEIESQAPSPHTVPLSFAHASSTSSITGASGGGRIQLPPIHTLSTRSPSIPSHPFVAAPPTASYYVRP
ncbi:hypothetical protein BGX26_003681 [Mortierella sp. AD094]|nr:hypothetical protein BGX26_003681 [Mortierella sp. AD094]